MLIDNTLTVEQAMLPQLLPLIKSLSLPQTSSDNNTDKEVKKETSDKSIVWKAGSEMMMKDIEPLFKNLKEEVLNNKFCSITKGAWNDILKKCHKLHTVWHLPHTFLHMIHEHIAQTNRTTPCYRKTHENG